jgi:small-conductance mechanosensitive channel
MIDDLFLVSLLKSLVVLLALVCLLRITQLTLLPFLVRITEKSKRNFFQFLVRNLARSWFFVILITSVYFSLLFLPLSLNTEEVAGKSFLILIIFYLVWFVHRLIGYYTETLIADRKERRRSVTSLKFFNRIFDIFLWIGSILLIISLLGYDITVLLAGLGVGGIIFALASQKILLELFSSFVLYSDHVFEEGDFIIIDDSRGGLSYARGRIEKIGVRSTHLRSPDGESVIIPNQELSTKIIYNYSKKKETKMTLSFSVSHETENNKLKQVSSLAKEVLDRHEMIRCGQIHFEEFKSNGPTFKIIFDLETTDHDQMQNIYQEIALSLREKLNISGIQLTGQ